MTEIYFLSVLGLEVSDQGGGGFASSEGCKGRICSRLVAGPLCLHTVFLLYLSQSITQTHTLSPQQLLQEYAPSSCLSPPHFPFAHLPPHPRCLFLFLSHGPGAPHSDSLCSLPLEKPPLSSPLTGSFSRSGLTLNVTYSDYLM